MLSYLIMCCQHPCHSACHSKYPSPACRDADGITALLDVLATPKTAAEMQERALSTIAFLATSAANAKILVASNGVPVLVPLLGARSDGVVIAAGGILRRLLPLPKGQASIPLHSSVSFCCPVILLPCDPPSLDALNATQDKVYSCSLEWYVIGSIMSKARRSYRFRSFHIIQ